MPVSFSVIPAGMTEENHGNDRRDEVRTRRSFKFKSLKWLIMKEVLFKGGKVIVEKVPQPSCGANQVLVKTAYSLISSGTELSSLTFSHQPLFLKVLKYPTKFAKGLRLVKQHGLKDAYNIVKGMLDMGVAPGYSCAGEVIKTGKNIHSFKKGDRVACAGANFASHAEIVAVPKNLVVKVPAGVLLKDAASTTIGSIALQGVRQADLRVGESALVIGLGLVGQIVSQILLASGVKVIGAELSSTRRIQAQKNGLQNVFSPVGKMLSREVNRLTNFQGVDATIITAAAPENNTIINTALNYTRKRGKVVVVGDVGLKVERLPWYEKEIDLRISTSYGPGRGDEKYEIRGTDYPYAYVRWTENRNMQAYLELLKDKKINFSSLVEKIYSLDKAAEAYQHLQSSKRPLAVLLEDQPEKISEDTKEFVINSSSKTEGKIEVGIIGVGSFAQTVHLPHLQKLNSRYHIRAICTRNQVKAQYFAKRYKADIATTDYHQLLKDPKINLIIVTTRHNLHAQIVKEAWQAGKNVFTEKPLCLTNNELSSIQKLVTSSPGSSSIITVGFNRRFSPFIKRIKELINKHSDPIIINYRVNDSYLPPNHWVYGLEGGGRVLGNACHMFDLFRYLIGSSIQDIQVEALSGKNGYYLPNDNFIASLKFKNGSLANLTYTTEGNSHLPKEYMELYSEGKVYLLNDYRSLQILGGKGSFRLSHQDKGHKEELEYLAEALHKGQWPIPFSEIEESTRISLEVNQKIRSQG